MQKSVIITAGGIGKRMGTTVPKQFLILNKLPILMHTINQFHAYDKHLEIIVVLPEVHITDWKELIKSFQFEVKHKIVSGGQERFFSIKNGLSQVTGDVVAVHDAVRPFVSLSVLNNVFLAAEKYDAVVPVVDLKESIRKVTKGSSDALDRSLYKLVQTPQCFRTSLLQKAYTQDYSNEFTDDASVVEKMGQDIHLVQGNDENIKITTPLDLKLAELISNK